LERNKQKIINDPVFGFIRIPGNFIFELIEHPFFQRLNRIKQLGLSYYVFPGAQHTRFQHTLGAMHLITEAIKVLHEKGVAISPEEVEATQIAILLHDIGHGPFSHALESSIVNIPHETISLRFFEYFNRMFDGRLATAMAVFNDTYEKHFLHQLVSGQLDVDRLDYLRRDSFYTGVTEGSIGSARIIKMLNVKDDNLVVDVKGIYSIEMFLVARRMMYWQVYLHKTAIVAENMLIKILERARELTKRGEKLFGTEALCYFLNNQITSAEFNNNDDILPKYAQLDDNDIIVSIKAWSNHNDKVLSWLSSGLINRKLLKIEITPEPTDKNYLRSLLNNIVKKTGISEEDASRYLVFSDSISSKLYSKSDDQINILHKDGTVTDISDTSDMFKLPTMQKTTEKFFVCYPRM